MSKDQKQKSNTTTVSIAEASQRLGICRTSVYNGIMNGSIPGKRINNRFCIPRESFEEYMRCGNPPVDMKQIERSIRKNLIISQISWLKSELAELEKEFVNET